MKPRIVLALCAIAVLTLYPSPSAAVSRCPNLVPDPGFESGVSGFFAQGISPTDPGPSEVTQTAVDPLAGSYSLRIDSRSSGQNIWWIYDYTGTGWYFGVSARLRSDVASASDIGFCAMAYYADATTALNCTILDGDAGDKGVVTASVNLDSTKPLASVRIRLVQSGLEDLQLTLDSVTTCLNPFGFELPLIPPPPRRF